MHDFLYGVRISVLPDPKYYSRLPDDVQVPDDFRREFDAWAERFFSPRPELNIVKDGQVCQMFGSTMVMNERTYAQFRKLGEKVFRP